MTDPQDKKPREFWIASIPHANTGNYTARDRAPHYGRDDIHVIEYSAFEAMRERAERAEAKYEELKSYLPKVPTQPYEKELAQENAALRVRIEKLREALKIIVDDTSNFSDINSIISSHFKAKEALKQDDEAKE